jgi:hypothetical protein
MHRQWPCSGELSIIVALCCIGLALACYSCSENSSVGDGTSDAAADDGDAAVDAVDEDGEAAMDGDDGDAAGDGTELADDEGELAGCGPSYDCSGEVPTIVSAHASTEDTNVAGNVLDGDLGTRWSGEGIGATIDLELSCAPLVEEVHIAAYMGDTRISYFDIQASCDGSEWQTILSDGQTSGTTIELETFAVTPANARFVRLVGRGSSENDWNSYTEIRINDYEPRPPDETDFDIKFSHDYENDTLGPYLVSEVLEDFETTYAPEVPELLFIEVKDGSKACKNVYPEGQYGTTGNGGTGTIYESYPEGMTDQDELYLSYNLFYEPGFDFGLGGKLPGMMGENYPLSGTLITYDQSFRIMMMWASGGGLQFYAYHHDNETIYGDSNGLFPGVTLPTGEWVNLTLRISLNDPTVRNGFCEAFVNGRLVSTFPDLNLRNYDYYHIDILYVETFMGGNSVDWAPDHTQYMWMDDFVVFRYRPGTPGVPAERSVSAPGTVIPLPNWPKP